MGNSFRGLFFRRFAAPRPGRRKAAELLGCAVDQAEIDVGKADDPIACLSLGNPNRLVDENLADKDEVAAPFDFTVAAYPPHGVIGVIPGLFDAIRIGAPRGLVVAARRLLAERLVRPLVVVVRAEPIEAALLLVWGGGRWLRGLFLERPMHALVPPVLLRGARIDAFEPDPELHPLNRQPAQAACAGRRKWRTIVRADRTRQSVLAEPSPEPRLHAFGRRRHDPTGHQKAAVRIADRQRVAPHPIGGAKPALEVRTPGVVG